MTALVLQTVLLWFTHSPFTCPAIISKTDTLQGHQQVDPPSLHIRQNPFHKISRGVLPLIIALRDLLPLPIRNTFPDHDLPVWYTSFLTYMIQYT